jgi:tetratricopeptide (TPR) repeat protein
MWKKIALMTLLIGCATGFAQQVSGDSLLKMLEQAKNFYNGGEYEKAISELENALQFLKQFKQIDQVEAYKYLAFSYVAFGDKDKAKEQFLRALKLDPKMELDPSTVSPKIIKVFEEAKSEFAATPPPVTPPVTPPVKTQPIPAHVSSLGATARSCCLPGWGQSYRGERSQGKTLMILTGITLPVALISTGIMDKKHQIYRDTPGDDKDAIDRAYRSYRIWDNIAVIGWASFAGVYLYNLYDIVLTKPGRRTSLGRTDDGFYITPEPNRIRCGYTFKF